MPISPATALLRASSRHVNRSQTWNTNTHNATTPLRPKSPTFWATQGNTWLKSGQSRPNSPKFDRKPNSADIGQNSGLEIKPDLAEIDQVWSTPRQTWPNCVEFGPDLVAVGPHRPIPAKLDQISAEVGPNLVEVGPHVAEIWSNSGQVVSTSSECGQLQPTQWPTSRPTSHSFDRSRAKFGLRQPSSRRVRQRYGKNTCGLIRCQCWLAMTEECA